MALAVASATLLFGNNFNNFDSSRKSSISVEIVQQYSSLSSDVLELYSLYNYIHKKVPMFLFSKHNAHNMSLHCKPFSFKFVR